MPTENLSATTAPGRAMLHFLFDEAPMKPKVIRTKTFESRTQLRRKLAEANRTALALSTRLSHALYAAEELRKANDERVEQCDERMVRISELERAVTRFVARERELQSELDAVRRANATLESQTRSMKRSEDESIHEIERLRALLFETQDELKAAPVRLREQTHRLAMALECISRGLP